jgi:hypothetical protein
MDNSPRLTISISITDPELIEELMRFPEGESRDDFVLAALRIGILTLKRAQGHIDADLLSKETDRLLENMTKTLKEFFDPKDGRFNERIDRLIQKDGEFERLMREQIGLDNSALSRTMAAYVGDKSEFMQILSTDESKGFLKALTETIGNRLTEQRENLLKEFSLDKEESALSRLIQHVKKSQNEITSEFSLDKEDSALYRMRRELLKVLEDQKKANEEFRKEVGEQLTAIAARREESERSTQHGVDFEMEAFDFIQSESQKAGDIATHTGNTTGLIKNCKIGDCVIKLGPDEQAAGTQIVVEAKEKEGYNLEAALAEIETARKNRRAAVGLFIFSKKSAHSGSDPMRRYGDDIVAIWDSEEPATDIYLSAALSVARALCTKAQAHREATEVDLKPIESAIRDIEKQISGLDEINKFTETIESNSTKILYRVKIMKKNLLTQVITLDDQINVLRSVMTSSPDS